jgi:hypothetical protein
MRGYGDSEKPPGVENYAMDLLVSDVKQVVEALGSYSNKFLSNFVSAKELWRPKIIDKRQFWFQ